MIHHITKFIRKWTDYFINPVITDESPLFQRLGEDVLDEIIFHLSNHDVIQFSMCCREFQKLSKSKRFIDYAESMMNTFPVHVIGSLSAKVFWDMTFVSYNPAWMGTTGYLDGVKPTNIHNPICWSRDTYGRLLIIIQKKRDVAVLFQRYTDDCNVWVFASNTLPIGGKRLDDEMYVWMKEWYAKK